MTVAGGLGGKRILVTGGTTGIGRATVRGLALRGATVVLTSRDPARAAAAAAEIAAGTGNPGITGWGGDLSRLGEVRRLAREITAARPTLDVLVNNAGAVYARREVTADGIERTWALNVLAPFLLTRLLEPALRAAAPSRVVHVASEAHRGAHIDLDDPERSGRYSAWGAYGQSKLALLLLTQEGAKRLAGSRVTVNAAHPGFVSSGFGRNNPGAFGTGMAVLETLFGISSRRGARTVVHLAAAPELAAATGGYYRRARLATPSRAARDPEMARRLWERCERTVGPISSG